MNDIHPHGFRNTLLRSFDAAIIARLNLSPLHFEIGHEIEFPGKPIRQLIFVEEGMASMTDTFKDGCQVEVGMFGFESVIGVSALMGTKRSLNRVYTQIRGSGFSCSVSAAEREFERGGDFQRIVLRYVQAQLVQATQSAGCNAKHRMEQRLARWLLLTADHANCNTFKLSHELMADMLGSTRSTLSLTASALKRDGLIEYSRGTVHIINRTGLESQSCECYQVIKDHLQNYAEFDHGQIG